MRELIFICEKCNKNFDDYEICLEHETSCEGRKSYICFRCNGIGHSANVCEAYYHNDYKLYW